MAKIYSSGMTPVNRTAERVIQPGLHYEPKLKPTPHSEQNHPHELRPINHIPAELRGLVGYKFGRMTVQGLSRKPKSWSVRCACGMYCLRKAAAIRNPANDLDACRICRQKLFVARENHWRRTGKDVDIKSLAIASPRRDPLPGAPVRGKVLVKGKGTGTTVKSQPEKDMGKAMKSNRPQRGSAPTALANAFIAAQQRKEMK